MSEKHKDNIKNTEVNFHLSNQAQQLNPSCVQSPLVLRQRGVTYLHVVQVQAHMAQVRPILH